MPQVANVSGRVEPDFHIAINTSLITKKLYGLTSYSRFVLLQAGRAIGQFRKERFDVLVSRRCTSM